jgi:hypothetical protein
MYLLTLERFYMKKLGALLAGLLFLGVSYAGTAEKFSNEDLVGVWTAVFDGRVIDTVNVNYNPSEKSLLKQYTAVVSQNYELHLSVPTLYMIRNKESVLDGTVYIKECNIDNNRCSDLLGEMSADKQTIVIHQKGAPEGYTWSRYMTGSV